MELLHTAHVPSGDGPFATILALHGWGASAHDLIGLAPILNAGKCLMLCPQGPVSLEIGQGMLGHGWFPIASGRPPDPEQFARGFQSLSRFVEQAFERYPIDSNHLVLLGFSQGGVMAYEMMLREPERYAGLAALSSWLPQELAAAHPPRPEHENKPVLVIHGTDDPMIPIDRARESRDALLPYRVNLSFREYPMGHEINPDALRSLVEWLDAKVVHLIELA